MVSDRLRILTLWIGLGGVVSSLSSVCDRTIPLVSSVRIGLASRVLLVQSEHAQDPVLSVNQSGVVDRRQTK